jgi:hypothetical protein
MVVKDSRIGLIIKPKKAEFLLRNKGRIQPLLQEAIHTGRCLLLDSLQLPNAAAQASDLAVGFEVFNTATLEAALCQVPFVTLDPGKCGYPYYKFGLNKIVFSDHLALKEKIQEFRISRDDSFFKDTPDYIDLMRSIEPFTDGKTTERVGFYLYSLLQEFAQGQNKEQAINKANQQYADKFGVDKVVACNG